MREAGRRDRQGRIIEISPYHGAVARQRAKQADPTKRRMAIVEPVCGVIKQVMGFRRCTVQGLENVQTQGSLICAAFHLRKMYKAGAAQPRARGATSPRPAPTA